MPTSAKSVCSYPGCNRVTRHGRCESHRKGNPDRPSPLARGYDKAWRRLRNVYIRANPICELQVKCDGAAGEEVDHIKPLKDGGRRLDQDNLQTVCKRCHSWKTRTQDYGDGIG